MVRHCLVAFVALLLIGCAEAPPSVQPLSTPQASAPAARQSAGGGTGLDIAVPPFASSDPKYQDVGRQIAEIIAADLVRSGRFPGRVPPTAALSAMPPTAPPRWADWKESGAIAVIRGHLAATDMSAGTKDVRALRIQVMLLDVEKQSMRLGRAYTVRVEGWRRGAHLIADDVQKALVGVDGAWGSRMVYITELPTGERRLAIMDQDGANRYFLTGPMKGLRDLATTGAGAEITYSVETRGGNARFRLSIETAHLEAVSPAAPPREVVSPDGTLIAFVRNDSLWVQTRQNGQEKQVARAVSPVSLAWASNGRKIAFIRKTSSGPRPFAVDIDTGHLYAIPTPDNAVEVAWLGAP